MPVLAAREIAVATDTGDVYIGDGVTPGGLLAGGGSFVPLPAGAPAVGQTLVVTSVDPLVLGWADGGAAPAVLGYVRLATSGATFSPVVEAPAGVTVTWTVEETEETQTGLTPSLSWGTAATRHVRMTATDAQGQDALDQITTLNLGYLHTDDAGQYVMGAQYDHDAQLVTGIEGLHLCTGLIRFAAANIPGLVGALSFAGLASLEYIECAYSRVQSVDLTGCVSLLRLCLEQNDLTALDLNPVAASLRDLRAAEQHGGALAFTALTAPLAQLYHLCIRDQDVTGLPNTATQLPVVEELWIFNTGQSGSLDVVSSALTSLQVYGNAYTSVTVTGGGHPSSIDMHGNAITTTAADALLTTVEAWGTSNGMISLAGNPGRTVASNTAVAALQTRGWTVTADGGGGGGGGGGGTTLWSDDFERANAVGFAAVGNGWAAAVGGAVSLVSGDLVRTDSGGYGAISNPAGGNLPADYRVTWTIAGASKTGGYLGIMGRWAGGNGVAAFFDGSLAFSSLRITNASGYMVSAVAPTADSALPASWANTAVDSTFALEFEGTAVRIYIDDVLVGHGTSTVNAAATGTRIGWVGEGANRHVRSVVVTSGGA